MFTRVNIPNQNSTSMTGWPMSRSCQSRSCCLLDVLEIVIDSVMDPTFHVTMSHTSPFNHQICQRQIQPSMVESVCVSPKMHQPQRNLPRRSFMETHSQADIPRLWTSALQLQNWRKRQLRLQQHVQEFSQTWREIGLMRQTFCNSILWHWPLPNQPTWRNDLQHHLARQPNQCSQNFCHQKLCSVCQRKTCNSQTIQIQPTTSCQLWQRNLRCMQTQTAFPQAWVQCLPSWHPTGSAVRTNKKNLSSVCFQSSGLRNNSNDLPQISDSLLFGVIQKNLRTNVLSEHKFLQKLLLVLKCLPWESKLSKNLRWCKICAGSEDKFSPQMFQCQMIQKTEVEFFNTSTNICIWVIWVITKWCWSNQQQQKIKSETNGTTTNQIGAIMRKIVTRKKNWRLLDFFGFTAGFF